MKKYIVERWVAALRSKKYKQGKKALKYKTKAGVTKHCCLGVLCELYQQDQRAQGKSGIRTGTSNGAMYEGRVPKGSRIYTFDRLFGTLPPAVKRWAGMRHDEGKAKDGFLLHAGRYCDESLADLNDKGATFAEIADAIERHRKEL